MSTSNDTTALRRLAKMGGASQIATALWEAANEIDSFAVSLAKAQERINDLEDSLRQCIDEWENDEPGTGGLTMQDTINDAREVLGMPLKEVTKKDSHT